MRKMPLNKHGYYEIRLESIGGLGANLCGKLLGELGALKLSFNASNFSDYGSEKRGSPVKAYIRFCAPEKPIRINSPVKEPQLLCIFHEGLLGRQPVLEGISKNTKIVLNTALSPEEACERWAFSPARLYCVDALGIAAEYHSRINMILLGAMAKASGFIPRSAVEELCRENIGQKYPDLIQENLAGIKQGWKALSAPYRAPAHAAPAVENQFTWGWDNAPKGGINPRPGSCVSNDLSPQGRAIFLYFCLKNVFTAGSAIPPAPIWFFSLNPATTTGKNAC